MFNILNFFTLRQLRKEKKQTEFDKKVWEARKPLIETQNQIEEEKSDLIKKRREIKFPSWGKMLLAILTINFIALEIFIGWVTIKSISLALAINQMPDFTPIVSLIGVVIGHSFSYWAYSSKSKAENTEGGIVYETAMAGLQQDTDEANGEGGVG